MPEPAPPSAKPAIVRTVMDALAYPFLHWGWAVFITACLSALMTLPYYRVRGGYLILYGALALVALIIRSYLTIVENTLTGYGFDIGDNPGLRAEGMWEDMLTMLAVAATSWGPAWLAAWLMPEDLAFKEAVVMLIGSLGCEYFCMAVMGTVVFGGVQGASPRFVLPAIWKCGGSYVFASLLLMLIPLSFNIGLGLFEAYGFGARFGAAFLASFVLIMQARLVALLYVGRKERIGWE